MSAERWVHVQVRTDDGDEVRWSMTEAAWSALLAAAEVGLDGATPESTGLEAEAIEDAWDAVQTIAPSFRE